MSLKFQLKSGKKIEIDLAPIEQGLNLYRSILIECKGAGLDLSVADDDTVMTLLMKNKENAYLIGMTNKSLKIYP